MSAKKTPVRIVRATRAQNNFGEMIKRVYENDEPQIIERAGMPVAAIVSISDFQRIYPQQIKSQPHLGNSARRLQAARELNAFLDRMGEASASLDEDKVYADVLKETMAVRRGRKKR